MELALSETDQRLYGKLHVTRDDIGFARSCASILLKKGWHSRPWERRGTVYFQQSVYTTALVTAYSRPFTQSKGWPRFSQSDIIVPSSAERELHDTILELRHSVYAHSDSKSYTIRPLRLGRGSVSFSSPQLRLAKEDAELFIKMADRMIEVVNGRALEIVSKYY